MNEPLNNNNINTDELVKHSLNGKGDRESLIIQEKEEVVLDYR
jgi:hypothetical protein